jgi:hypothetical protein
MAAPSLSAVNRQILPSILCPFSHLKSASLGSPNLRKSPRLLAKLTGGIFARHAERGAWVRFDSIAHSAECDRFLEFLLKLEIGPKHIELISGDSSRKSAFIVEWSRAGIIKDRGLAIKPSGSKSRNFTQKSALYVRPKFGSGCSVVDVNPAGYSFAMEMAFVAFGRIQESQSR